MAIHLDPRYLELITQIVDAAEEEFDRQATKLNPFADAIRKELCLISALYSVHHEYFAHEGEDREPNFRRRILTQSIADFHLLMSDIENLKPECPLCRND